MPDQPPMPAKTAEVFEVLKRCAHEMRTATYGEVAAAVGLSNFTPSVFPHLNRIRDDICIPRGLPWLPAIAVNATTRIPGEGFLPDSVVIHDAYFRTWWRGMVLQVFATDWAGINLDNAN